MVNDWLLKERAERQESYDELLARREHLKRQYLHFYQMKRKAKNKKIEDQTEKYKRMLLRMMGRD